jgi:hypothetical protein
MRKTQSFGKLNTSAAGIKKKSGTIKAITRVRSKVSMRFTEFAISKFYR